MNGETQQAGMYERTAVYTVIIPHNAEITIKNVLVYFSLFYLLFCSNSNLQLFARVMYLKAGFILQCTLIF